jgi:O-methyltransferase
MLDFASMHRLKRVLVQIHGSRWFLSKAASKEDRQLRSSLLKRFNRIDRTIGGAHEKREMLVMVDFLLTTKASGCMVECGCFRGASSAKLSLVAAATERKLYICDSFAGLPDSLEGDRGFTVAASGEQHIPFKRGLYAAEIEVVRENIRRLGDISVCTLVPGFFSESLPGLEVSPCFIFSDADLVQSTRDVLRALWPRLVPGGRFYSHDMNLMELVEGTMDSTFWLEEIGEPPPVLYGAGFGCGFGAGAIAFCIKKKSRKIH